jgi:single-strand DNA-binding protein
MSETGKLRVTFTLATNLNYRDRGNKWKNETTFTPVAVWDKLAEAVAHHLHKGSGVFLTGRLKSRRIETAEGNRTILEVIARNIQFLDKREREEDNEEPELKSF